ncbi:hypothetical protein MCEMRE196_01192 [Candidatus Nanopelagicaceae bacterium]
MLKKLEIAIVTAIISIGLVASSNAAINSVGDPGRFWAQPNDDALGLHVQQFAETSPSEPTSFLVPGRLPEIVTSDPTCSSMSAPNCAGKELQFSAVLPQCLSDADVDCLQDFGVISESGVKTSAKFSRYFPAKAQNAYEGSPKAGLPAGASGSLYELPSATHDGGNLYYIAPMITGSVAAFGVITTPKLEVRVSPVAIENTSATHPTLDAGWGEIYFPNSGQTRWGLQGGATSGTQACAATSAKEKACAQKYAFPADTRFYVTLRVSQIPGGWMHGRISSPDIQVSKLANFSLLEIQGNPIAVPIAYKVYRYQEMPAELKNLYDVEKGGYKATCSATQSYCAGGRTGPSKDPLNRNVIIAPSPSAADGMEQLKIWLPYLNDKATALPSFWSVRSLSAFEMEGASDCFTDSSKITGIVTTNSTQYSAGPPKFDKSEGTLGYQVASPHYGTTGDVFKGSYDLVMRSEVARCVYGFSKAPIQASLSITSADGSQQVATTIIGERNGWLYLTAKNFEFSAPVIKAKLSQEATVTPEPEMTTQAAPATKKITITCVKGKTTKKVTAVKPKCPTGYKKKG